MSGVIFESILDVERFRVEVRVGESLVGNLVKIPIFGWREVAT